MGVNAQIEVPAFTAGQVLTAAEMTQINTGIPVFATTTTRDNSFGGSGEKVLAEGQFAYIEATDTTQYYNGSAWVSVGTTPGLVPVTPTSVAVGSGSATTSANGQVTFTGASSISLNGVFSATYDNYRIILSPDAASTTFNITARLRISGTDVTTAASYQQENIQASDSSVVGAGDLSQTLWYIIDNYNTTYPFYAAAAMELQRPFITKKKTMLCDAVFVSSAGNFRKRQSGHTQESTSACDGFSIICASGNMGGTISVYGYTK